MSLWGCTIHRGVHCFSVFANCIEIAWFHRGVYAQQRGCMVVRRVCVSHRGVLLPPRSDFSFAPRLPCLFTPWFSSFVCTMTTTTHRQPKNAISIENTACNFKDINDHFGYGVNGGIVDNFKIGKFNDVNRKPTDNSGADAPNAFNASKQVLDYRTLISTKGLQPKSTTSEHGLWRCPWRDRLDRL